MPSITMPAGVIPIKVLTLEEELTGNRAAEYRIDIMDRDGKRTGKTLDGVFDGELTWTANAQVKGGGYLEVRDVAQDVDWLNVRLQPVYVLGGTILPEWPLSTWLVTAAPAKADEKGRIWRIEIHDLLTVLQQTAFDESYSLDAGVNAIDTVRTLIESTGESAGSITDSTETLRVPRIWPADTPLLTIINDILDAAGYFALQCDMTGTFRVEKKNRPAERPSNYHFIDNTKSSYLPDIDEDNDIYGIPNKVTLFSRSTADTPALTATATNTDPNSKYSYQARGNRWITPPGSTKVVDATSQEVLDAMARQELINLSSPTAQRTIQHAPLNNLTFNDATKLTNTALDIHDRRHVVSQTTLRINGRALATTKLREVVDL